MPLLPAPAQLGHSEKDALIAALTARLASADTRIAAQNTYIAVQDARIAALEARLDALSRPPKTPGNSSKPPSQGHKQDRPAPLRIARRAKAAPALAGRCIRTRIARSTDGWLPARSARQPSPKRRRARSRSTNASSCHPFGPT